MKAPTYTGRGAVVLDFDIENRPLNYAGEDFTFGEITAIACMTIGKRRSLESWVLGEVEMEQMLAAFLARWNTADVVTGHNIIRHDLPWLNGMLLELGLGPLPAKMVHDTYSHLKRRRGVSASQESLAGMLGVPAPKIAMSQMAWRQANRLLPEGLVKTRARCVGDVVQHAAMRERLLELDWLGPARMWRP